MFGIFGQVLAIWRIARQDCMEKVDGFRFGFLNQSLGSSQTCPSRFALVKPSRRISRSPRAILGADGSPSLRGARVEEEEEERRRPIRSIGRQRGTMSTLFPVRLATEKRPKSIRGADQPAPGASRSGRLSPRVGSSDRTRTRGRVGGGRNVLNLNLSTFRPLQIRIDSDRSTRRSETRRARLGRLATADDRRTKEATSCLCRSN